MYVFGCDIATDDATLPIFLGTDTSFPGFFLVSVSIQANYRKKIGRIGSEIYVNIIINYSYEPK